MKIHRRIAVRFPFTDTTATQVITTPRSLWLLRRKLSHTLGSSAYLCLKQSTPLDFPPSALRQCKELRPTVQLEPFRALRQYSSVNQRIGCAHEMRLRFPYAGSIPQPARLLVLLCATDQMRYKPNLMALAVICVIPYITIRTAEGSPIRNYRVIAHDRVVIGMCLRIIVIG